MKSAVVGLALLIANLEAADRVVVYVENDRAVSQEVEWRAESIAKRMFRPDRSLNRVACREARPSLRSHPGHHSPARAGERPEDDARMH